MSTYYGYRCKQDGAVTDQWFNHGEHILRDCVKVWPEVKKIRDTKSWYLEVHIMGHGEMGDLWSFLEEHYKHGIELLDEYGRSKPIEEEK